MVVKIKVIFSTVCPACSVLLGFEPSLSGPVKWLEPTPFRRALHAIISSGLGVVKMIAIRGDEDMPQELAPFSLDLLLPAAVSNRMGLWSPVPLDLTEEEYKMILLGLMPKKGVRRAKGHTYLQSLLWRRAVGL